MTIFHRHKFSKWTFHSYSPGHYDAEYWKQRYCVKCGKVEQISLTFDEYMKGIKEEGNDLRGTRV